MALSERVLELERQGFIPKDNETEEQYLERVEPFVARMEEFMELVREKPEELKEFFGGDISQLTLYDSEESGHLLEDAYDFMPLNYPIFALDGPFDAWVRSSSIGQNVKIAGIRTVSKVMDGADNVFARIAKRPPLKTYGYTGHDICIEYKDVLIPTAFIRRAGQYDNETAAHETLHLIRHALGDKPRAHEVLFPFNIWKFAKEKDKLLEECLAFYLNMAARKGRDIEDYVTNFMPCFDEENRKGPEGRYLGLCLKSYLNENLTLSMSAVCILNALLTWQQKPRTPASVGMGSWYMLQGTSEAVGLHDKKKSLPRIIDDMLTVEEELTELYGRKAGQAITARLKREEMHEIVEIILDQGDVGEYLANGEGLRWDIIRERYLQAEDSSGS